MSMENKVPIADQEQYTYENAAKAKRIILVDNTGNIIKLIRTRENLAGSAGTGSDGDTNRVYTLTTTNTVDIVEVYYNGVLQVETTDYTIDNNNKQVTMLINVWDTDLISIFYNV
ncbi:MAG: hypothetical protein ACTSR3_05895 [Candidatus Helarchaeota archaeon]